MWVNRRLGRFAAAAAYVLGLTPTWSRPSARASPLAGVALIALGSTWPAAIGAALMLVIGYLLDSADGRSRLRGGGSLHGGVARPHGRLGQDHRAVHLAVLIHLYRYADVSSGWLLVPLGFTVVAVSSFFAQLLNEQLRRNKLIATRPAEVAAVESASLLSSIVKLPQDYGVLCWTFVLLAASTAFLSVYTFLFAFNLGYLTLASRRWFFQIVALDAEDRGVTRSRRHLLLAGMLAATVLLVACSSDDDGSPSTTSTTAADGSTSTTSTTEASTTGGTDAGTTDGTGDGGSTGSVDVDALPPVAVGESVDFGDGLVATVTKVQQVDLESSAPGETAGPGVIVTLELQNDTDDTVDLAGVAINAAYGDTPAIPHRTAPIEALSGTLAPGARSSGTYAFRVPADQMDAIVIDVHHAGEVSYVVVDVGEAAQ